MSKGEYMHVTIERPGFPWMLRALYFVFIGWWFTLIWINVAWAANATVIGLPLGLWMLNRVPQVLTLRPVAVETHAYVVGDRLYVRSTGVRQHFWFVRLLYFALIGWWLSLLWSNVAWFFCATIVGLPIGLAMFNQLPAITTLARA